jgi:hypothetical protein
MPCFLEPGKVGSNAIGGRVKDLPHAMMSGGRKRWMIDDFGFLNGEKVGAIPLRSPVGFSE